MGVSGVESGVGGGDYGTQGATEAPVTDSEASAPTTESEGATATESANATNATDSTYATQEEATEAARSGGGSEAITRNADGTYGAEATGSGPESGGASDVDPSVSSDQQARALEEAMERARQDRGPEAITRNPDGSYRTTPAN